MALVAEPKTGSILGKIFAVAFLGLLSLAYFHSQTGHWEPLRVALLFGFGAGFIEATKRITGSRKLDSFNPLGLVIFYVGILITTYIVTWHWHLVRVLIAVIGIYLATRFWQWTKSLPNPILAKSLLWISLAGFTVGMYLVIDRPIDWFLVVLSPTFSLFHEQKSKKDRRSSFGNHGGIAKF